MEIFQTAVRDASRTDDDALVRIAARDGNVFITTKGDIRKADYLKLPNGEFISLQGTVIQCELTRIPERELVRIMPWN